MRRGTGLSRSQELIFLDPDDDLGTIRAKLESSPADEVFDRIGDTAEAWRSWEAEHDVYDGPNKELIRMSSRVGSASGRPKTSKFRSARRPSSSRRSPWR